ncbi:GNAT family N-acetyltransferase [Enterococcus termitis]
MKKILENERLYLRELSEDDFEDLCAILQDEETMYAYEAPFTDEEVTDWLNWNLASYQKMNLVYGQSLIKVKRTLLVNAALFIQKLKEKTY